MVGIVARLSIGGLEAPHVITQFGTSQQSCLRQVIQIPKTVALSMPLAAKASAASAWVSGELLC